MRTPSITVGKPFPYLLGGPILVLVRMTICTGIRPAGFCPQIRTRNTKGMIAPLVYAHIRPFDHVAALALGTVTVRSVLGVQGGVVLGQSQAGESGIACR